MTAQPIDGAVHDGAGTLLGFIEPNGEVGTAAMRYVGRAHPEGACLVVDHRDEPAGAFDAGRGLVRDPSGSVVAALSRGGALTDHAGQSVGVVDGFGYDRMATIAAYLLLLDRQLL